VSSSFFINNKEIQRKYNISQTTNEEIKIYSISIEIQKLERARHTKNKNKKGGSEI